MADIGYGILVEMSKPAAPTVWTTISEVYDISLPQDKIDQVDTTHYRSANRRREYVAGLIDGGEASLQMNYNQGSATDAYCQTARGDSRNVRITFPDGYIISFAGNVSSYERSTPLDGKKTATMAMQVSGAVTETAAAAPTNTIAPAISGLPKVGVVLTAMEGIWTGAPTFTYQWKKGGTNISGATTNSYTPVSGDIGGAITVTVTGTNATGNLAVTSTAAIAVVA